MGRKYSINYPAPKRRKQSYKGHKCGWPIGCAFPTDIEKIIASGGTSDPLGTNTILSNGDKFDGNKNPLDLVPDELILAVGEILKFGAKKYDAHNWRKGIPYSRVYSAMFRHLTAWHNGEETDPESNLHHLHHAACNLAFLITYEAYPERYTELDDRYIYELQKIKAVEIAKVPGVPVTAYFSHSIRGKDGNNATTETMEANMAKAKTVAREIRELCRGKINLYVPAENDTFVQIAWKNRLITDKQILDVDCQIVEKKDLLIAYNYDGTSQGMVREVRHAIDKGVATAYVCGNVESTDHLIRVVDDMYKEKNQCVSS